MPSSFILLPLLLNCTRALIFGHFADVRACYDWIVHPRDATDRRAAAPRKTAMDAESALVLLRQHGPLALVVVMALNRLGLVPGGMVILVTVGAFAGQGELSIAAAIATAYAGTMIGDTALYGAGRFGLGWLTRRQERRNAWGRAHAAIERWGVPAVFFTRWLVLPLTIAVSLICGLNRFRYRPFVLLGAAGNLLFVLIFLGIGYRFGDGWRQVLAWAGAAVGRAFQSPTFLVGSATLILGALVAYRLAANRRPHLVAVGERMKDEG